jgi:hypothetical protein
MLTLGGNLPGCHHHLTLAISDHKIFGMSLVWISLFVHFAIAAQVICRYVLVSKVGFRMQLLGCFQVMFVFFGVSVMGLVANIVSLSNKFSVAPHPLNVFDNLHFVF